MEPYTTALITGLTAIIVALLGGGGVVIYFLKRRQHKAEAVNEEQKNELGRFQIAGGQADTFKQLSDAVEEMVNDKLKQQRQIMKVEQEKLNLEMMVKIKEGMIDEMQENFKEIYLEQGAARERERICQENLTRVSLELQQVKTQLGQSA